MRWRSGCILLCGLAALAVLGLYIAHAQAPLALSWQPAGLRVTWAADRPVCLYLVGGGLPEQRVADVPCSAAGEAVLARGADYLLSPVNRTHVELRDQADLRVVVLGVAIPPQCGRCVVILPVVVGN